MQSAPNRYLRTNDARVAVRFAPPATRWELDGLTPAALTARHLGRCLVGLEGAQPSEAWLAEQMPPLYRVRRGGYEVSVGGTACRVQEEARAAARAGAGAKEGGAGTPWQWFGG